MQDEYTAEPLSNVVVVAKNSFTKKTDCTTQEKNTNKK
jgi:hypothetical protein